MFRGRLCFKVNYVSRYYGSTRTGPADRGDYVPGLVPVIFENLTFFTSFKIGAAKKFWCFQKVD